MPLTVTLLSNDTGEATVPAQVHDTGPIKASAAFLVTGVDDGLMDGTQAVTGDGLRRRLRHGQRDRERDDNDVAGITVRPTGGLTTTEAGGTATFTVVLTSHPRRRWRSG